MPGRSGPSSGPTAPARARCCVFWPGCTRRTRADSILKADRCDPIRDGSAPNMARWLSENSHYLVEWEPDLSSQTGASQAGILLGSNEDIPAFRWVEKETGLMMTCSAPDDCPGLQTPW